MHALNRFCFSILSICFVLLVSETSFAKVCVTGMKAGGSSSSSNAMEFDQFAAFGYGEEAVLHQASLTCQDLQATKLGLRAMLYTFTLARLGLACGPAGIPVAVGMFSAGAVLYTAELVVNSIPCEDKSKEEIEATMKREICQALRDQGIQCDPNKMVRN